MTVQEVDYLADEGIWGATEWCAELPERIARADNQDITNICHDLAGVIAAMSLSLALISMDTEELAQLSRTLGAIAAGWHGYFGRSWASGFDPSGMASASLAGVS